MHHLLCVVMVLVNGFIQYKTHNDLWKEIFMNLSTVKMLDDLINNHKQLDCVKEIINDAVEALIKCYSAGGKVLTCGNGGSASDALHIVGELMKGFALKRPLLPNERIFSEEINEGLQRTLPAISLVSETALITAYINDVSAELVYAQQVFGYGNSGDILIALSTSGNSKNILYAAEVAKVKKIKVISLTGKDGGKIKSLSDITICVPEIETFKVQELHLPIYHALCLAVENEFFGDVG